MNCKLNPKQRPHPDGRAVLLAAALVFGDFDAMLKLKHAPHPA